METNDREVEECGQDDRPQQVSSCEQQQQRVSRRHSTSFSILVDLLRSFFRSFSHLLRRITTSGFFLFFFRKINFIKLSWLGVRAALWVPSNEDFYNRAQEQELFMSIISSRRKRRKIVRVGGRGRESGVQLSAPRKAKEEAEKGEEKERSSLIDEPHHRRQHHCQRFQQNAHSLTLTPTTTPAALNPSASCSLAEAARIASSRLAWRHAYHQPTNNTNGDRANNDNTSNDNNNTNASDVSRTRSSGNTNTNVPQAPARKCHDKDEYNNRVESHRHSNRRSSSDDDKNNTSTKNEKCRLQSNAHLKGGVVAEGGGSAASVAGHFFKGEERVIANIERVVVDIDRKWYCFASEVGLLTGGGSSSSSSTSSSPFSVPFSLLPFFLPRGAAAVVPGKKAQIETEEDQEEIKEEERQNERRRRALYSLLLSSTDRLAAAAIGFVPAHLRGPSNKSSFHLDSDDILSYIVNGSEELSSYYDMYYSCLFTTTTTTTTTKHKEDSAREEDRDDDDDDAHTGGPTTCRGGPSSGDIRSLLLPLLLPSSSSSSSSCSSFPSSLFASALLAVKKNQQHKQVPRHDAGMNARGVDEEQGAARASRRQEQQDQEGTSWSWLLWCCAHYKIAVLNEVSAVQCVTERVESFMSRWTIEGEGEREGGGLPAEEDNEDNTPKGSTDFEVCAEEQKATTDVNNTILYSAPLAAASSSPSSSLSEDALLFTRFISDARRDRRDNILTHHHVFIRRHIEETCLLLPLQHIILTAKVRVYAFLIVMLLLSTALLLVPLSGGGVFVLSVLKHHGDKQQQQQHDDDVYNNSSNTTTTAFSSFSSSYLLSIYDFLSLFAAGREEENSEGSSNIVADYLPSGRVRFQASVKVRGEEGGGGGGGGGATITFSSFLPYQTYSSGLSLWGFSTTRFADTHHTLLWQNTNNSGNASNTNSNSSGLDNHRDDTDVCNTNTKNTDVDDGSNSREGYSSHVIRVPFAGISQVLGPSSLSYPSSSLLSSSLTLTRYAYRYEAPIAAPTTTTASATTTSVGVLPSSLSLQRSNTLSCCRSGYPFYRCLCSDKVQACNANNSTLTEEGLTEDKITKQKDTTTNATTVVSASSVLMCGRARAVLRTSTTFIFLSFLISLGMLLRLSWVLVLKLIPKKREVEERLSSSTKLLSNTLVNKSTRKHPLDHAHHDDDGHEKEKEEVGEEEDNEKEVQYEQTDEGDEGHPLKKKGLLLRGGSHVVVVVDDAQADRQREQLQEEKEEDASSFIVIPPPKTQQQRQQQMLTTAATPVEGESTAVVLPFSSASSPSPPHRHLQPTAAAATEGSSTRLLLLPSDRSVHNNNEKKEKERMKGEVEGGNPFAPTPTQAINACRKEKQPRSPRVSIGGSSSSSSSSSFSPADLALVASAAPAAPLLLLQSQLFAPPPPLSSQCSDALQEKRFNSPQYIIVEDRNHADDKDKDKDENDEAAFAAFAVPLTQQHVPSSVTNKKGNDGGGSEGVGVESATKQEKGEREQERGEFETKSFPLSSTHKADQRQQQCQRLSQTELGIVVMPVHAKTATKDGPLLGVSGDGDRQSEEEKEAMMRKRSTPWTGPTSTTSTTTTPSSSSPTLFWTPSNTATIQFLLIFVSFVLLLASWGQLVDFYYGDRGFTKKDDKGEGNTERYGDENDNDNDGDDDGVSTLTWAPQTFSDSFRASAQYFSHRSRDISLMLHSSVTSEFHSSRPLSLSLPSFSSFPFISFTSRSRSGSREDRKGLWCAGGTRSAGGILGTNGGPFTIPSYTTVVVSSTTRTTAATSDYLVHQSLLTITLSRVSSTSALAHSSLFGGGGTSAFSRVATPRPKVMSMTATIVPAAPSYHHHHDYYAGSSSPSVSSPPLLPLLNVFPSSTSLSSSAISSSKKSTVFQTRSKSRRSSRCCCHTKRNSDDDTEEDIDSTDIDIDDDTHDCYYSNDYYSNGNKNNKTKNKDIFELLSRGGVCLSCSGSGSSRQRGGGEVDLDVYSRTPRSDGFALGPGLVCIIVAWLMQIPVVFLMFFGTRVANP